MDRPDTSTLSLDEAQRNHSFFRKRSLEGGFESTAKRDRPESREFQPAGSSESRFTAGEFPCPVTTSLT
eukprot:m.83879 g.83879  ORF g.83879 m.83879 type:complete len:69 (+) comp19669_c0_seq1:2258-2464(+)